MSRPSTDGFLRSVAVYGPVAIVAAVVGLGCATREQYLRLRRDQRDVRQLLADTRSDLEAQRRMIESLRGQMDEVRQGRRPGGAGESGTDLVALEQRVSALEAGLAGRPVEAGPGPTIAAVPPSPPEPGPTGPEDAARERAAPGSGTPGEDRYRAALGLVEQGNYTEAISRFLAYLREYPETALSDNAQYWIGECHYAKRDFNNAILAFYEVTRRYPKGDKVCAAMLKQGLAFAELGDLADARLVLERLVQEHPTCEEAARAREKLAGFRQR
jgi:tol-pal system protein YbgF